MSQQTYIIESNRQTAYREIFDAEKTRQISENTAEQPNHKWTTTIPYGIKLNEGDSIQIEASQINLRGDVSQTLEFTGGSTNQGSDPISDNKASLFFTPYISNNLTFNFPLPTASMAINYRPLTLQYGAPDFLGRNGLNEVVDTASWALFANCNPIQNIQGFLSRLDNGNQIPEIFTSTADMNMLSRPPMTNAPIEIFHPSSVRLYKLRSDNRSPYNGQDGADGLYTTLDRNTRKAEQLLELMPVDLVQKEGFSTPSALANNLTSQLQAKTGNADTYTTENIATTPVVMRKKGAFPPSDSSVSATTIRVADFSNELYKIFPTASGDFVNAYLDGTAFCEYANIQPAGIPYVPVDWADGTPQDPKQRSPYTTGKGFSPQKGYDLFWKNMLTGDIDRYTSGRNFCKFSQYVNYQDQLLTKYLDKTIYEMEEALVFGGRGIASGFSANSPCLGWFIVSLDRLDNKVANMTVSKWEEVIAGDTRTVLLDPTKPASAEYNAGRYEKYSDDDLGMLVLKENQPVASNIIATTKSVKMLKECMYPLTRPSLTVDNSEYQERGVKNIDVYKNFVSDIQFGRLDDQLTSTTTSSYNPDSLKFAGTNQISMATPLQATIMSQTGYTTSVPASGLFPPQLASTYEPLTFDPLYDSQNTNQTGVGGEEQDYGTGLKSGDMNICNRRKLPALVGDKYKSRHPFYTYWRDEIDLITDDDLGEDTIFSVFNPDGERYNNDIFRPDPRSSQDRGLGCIGLFIRGTMKDGTPLTNDKIPWLDAVNPLYKDIRYIPFIAYISAEDLNVLEPAPVGDPPTYRNENNNFPWVQTGEFFACSMSFQDQKLSKIISTQQTNMEELGETISGNADIQSLNFYKDGNQYLMANPVGSQPDAMDYRNHSFTTPSNKADVLYPPIYPSRYTNVDFTPFHYQGYVHIGAENPLIGFDDVSGKFKFSQLHTALRAGNGSYSNIRQPKVADTTGDGYVPNQDFATEILEIYSQGSAISQYMGGLITTGKGYLTDEVSDTIDYQLLKTDIPNSIWSMGTNSYDGIDQQYSWNTTAEPPPAGKVVLGMRYKPASGKPFPFVSQINDQNNPINSSQSGVAIYELQCPNADSTKTVKMSCDKPFQYLGSLFDKMGFDLEQLIPFVGKQNSIFNRENYNRFIGYGESLSNKYQNMVKPATTNAYISGNLALGFTQNYWGSPMENLGAVSVQIPAKTEAVSDAIIANKIAKKMSYPYLVVHSDIIEQHRTFYGGSYICPTPSLGYISRNYSEADYFFGFSTDWEYIVDKNHLINSFTVDIRLPNGQPAPLDSNSSLIFKIIKNNNPEIIIKNKDTNNKKKRN
tara:strand:- start:3096 stop:7076 length:3981 start_codon:yes stop_codon:yes gene_type:complete